MNAAAIHEPTHHLETDMTRTAAITTIRDYYMLEYIEDQGWNLDASTDEALTDLASACLEYGDGHQSPEAVRAFRDAEAEISVAG